MADLHVELVSVEREVWSGEATMVVARTTEGEIGILPGGTRGSALLQVALTVVRRAERRTWALLEQQPEATSKEPALYLNRLSDLLFILSRVANGGNDVKWVRRAGA